MFTGIVQGRGRILFVSDSAGIRRLQVALPAGRADGLQIGASVSVAGVCLTVVEIQDHQVSFDVIDETLRRTRLGALQVGEEVNIERAARFGDEIGGHLLSGHIWGTAEVVDVHPTDQNLRIQFRAPNDAMGCLLPKGYVGIDGCSLTIGTVEPERQTFNVHLIPETLRVTTLGALAVGHRVNLELDAMTQAVVATVHRVLKAGG
jgi:riboflavin synthase